MPIRPLATTAVSHASPTEMSAHTRAPRTMAPTIANARAMNGGPASGGTNRSSVVSAATTATVTPGQRRAARRPRADAAASATLRSPHGAGTSCQMATPIVAGTWITNATTTGTNSVTAGGGPNRGPEASWFSRGMRSIVRREPLGVV